MSLGLLEGRVLLPEMPEERRKKQLRYEKQTEDREHCQHTPRFSDVEIRLCNLIELKNREFAQRDDRADAHDISIAQ